MPLQAVSIQGCGVRPGLGKDVKLRAVIVSYVNKVKWICTFYLNSSFVGLTHATGYLIQWETPAAFGRVLF